MTNGRESIGDEDRRHLAMALALARRGHPFTSPNPLVGAVVVRDGAVIGTGHHARAGAPHAECPALQAAGSAARGATLYVNLEPCCHQGKTPPCTRAIIAAGIARVVACLGDPNPLVNGQGFAELFAAGIRVSVGGLVHEAARLNEIYLRAMRTKRPFGILKAAQTLDGRIATASGQSKWITSPWARDVARHLRSVVDGTAVGLRTVLADDPDLRAPREDGGPPRLRIVFDSRLATPPQAKLFTTTSTDPVLVLCTDRAAVDAERGLRAKGADVLRLRANADGRVDLAAAARALFERGIHSLLYEGGGTIAAALLEDSLVDRALLFLAPKLMGGREGLPVIGGSTAPTIDGARALRPTRTRRVGPDVLYEADLFGIEDLIGTAS